MSNSQVIELQKAGNEQLPANPEPENGHAPLFPDTERENFQSRWHEIQANFVDEPRRAVEEANQLVDSVIRRLTEVFANERGRMEQGWSKDQDISTEDFRQSLRRYRSFFDRLLSV